jgi:RND family efflux transporter MFP subunit
MRIFAVTFFAALLGACSPPDQAAPRSVAPIPVQVTPASLRPVERFITVSGSLFPNEQAPVSARVPGRLQHLPADLGSRVRSGDLLAEIDPRDFELRVLQARGLLSQARARLGLPLDGNDDQVNLDATSLVKQADAVLSQARRERDRIAELSRQGIASASDLEATHATFTVAEGRYSDALEEARTRAAVLRQRRAEYELALRQLSDTRIIAPFDGIISERRASLGQHVEIGTPLLTLVQADPLRLRVEIPERDAPRVAIGQSVRVRLTGDTNLYHGAIRRLSPSLLEASRMLVVEADIPASGALRPGAFARAEIVVESALPVLTIPSDALVTFAGVERVFVLDSNKASERRVDTGDRGDGWIEIVRGVKQGEQVILSPGGLVDGRAVRLDPSVSDSGSQP